MLVHCPSGLKGHIRKLKGSEANILADRKAARKGDTYNQILSACWESIEDPGPYDFTDKVNWDKVLVCDRFYILTRIRIHTFGSEYDFKLKCPACDKKFDYEIDLENDLDVYALPDESKNKIKEGENCFETELGDKKLCFSLATGATEKKASKILEKKTDEIITQSLATRILSIEDVEKRDIPNFLKSVDLDEQLGLIEEMDNFDGGIETTIEVACAHCDEEFELQLPFEGEGFWLPRKSSKKKSRNSRKLHRG